MQWIDEVWAAIKAKAEEFATVADLPSFDEARRLVRSLVTERSFERPLDEVIDFYAQELIGRARLGSDR